MTLSVKDRFPDVQIFTSSFSKKRNEIIDFLFRNCSITHNDDNIVNNLSERDWAKLLGSLTHGEPQIRSIVGEFLINAIAFTSFFRENPIKWNSDLKVLSRKIRIYLRRIHRLIPVFDYNRARTNLIILQSSLNKRLFWPIIGTQVAIIIYVTDLNDTSNPEKKKILQKNIRAICNCSAYSFHRTRNILHI